MNEYTELHPGEVVVPPVDELLFRQIANHNWDPIARKPSSSSFGPDTIDRKMPSFSRSTKVAAQDSRDWHRHNARSDSAGVWACSAREVADAGTRTVDDSDCPADNQNPRSPGHCYVDYRPYGKPGERIVRAELLAAALARGEVDTVECEMCSRFAKLGADQIAVLREEVERWINFNGSMPDSSSGDPEERRHANTLVHIRDIGTTQ